MSKTYLHVIVTGGTIASETLSDGVIHLAGTSRTFGNQFIPEILDMLKAKAPEDSWELRISSPYYIHSENLNLHYLNLLITHLKKVSIEKPDAVFLFVGTDTLAYISNLLSLLCIGLPFPIYLISANFPIAHPASNARANIERAVWELCDNPVPGIFVPYRNMDGEMHLHRGEALLQAVNFSDDFTAIKNSKVNNLVKIHAMNTLPSLMTVPELTTHILAIHPYPGMDYNVYDLSKVDAILHGTYHSYTVSGEKDGFSLLVQNAQEIGIPVYIAPAAAETRPSYASTAHIFEKDTVIALPELTFEMAYCYLLLNVEISVSLCPHLRRPFAQRESSESE